MVWTKEHFVIGGMLVYSIALYCHVNEQNQQVWIIFLRAHTIWERDILSLKFFKLHLYKSSNGKQEKIWTHCEQILIFVPLLFCMRATLMATDWPEKFRMVSLSGLHYCLKVLLTEHIDEVLPH